MKRNNALEDGKNALLLCLKNIQKETVFNILVYGEKQSWLSEKSIQASEINVKKIIEVVRGLQANMSSKNLEMALRAAYNYKSTNMLPKIIFLITDSNLEKSNPEVCLELIRKNSRFHKVCAIGVGKPDEKEGYFALAAAEVGKGHCEIYDEKNPNLAENIKNMVQRAGIPTITNFKL